MALKVYFFGSMDEPKSRNEDDDKAELEALEKRARGVIGFLLGIILGFTGVSWGLFTYVNCQYYPNLLLLCICVSIVGSATAAFMSCLQRVSDGWELADGQQIPKPNNKERFNAKLAYVLLFRRFFAKTLLDKLKDIFESLIFGNKKR